jgi:hypothetical protein
MLFYWDDEPKSSRPIPSQKLVAGGDSGDEGDKEVILLVPQCNTLLLKQNKFRGLSRERIVPNERPPLVGEVSANFCG